MRKRLPRRSSQSVEQPRQQPNAPWCNKQPKFAWQAAISPCQPAWRCPRIRASSNSRRNLTRPDRNLPKAPKKLSSKIQFNSLHSSKTIWIVTIIRRQRRKDCNYSHQSFRILWSGKAAIVEKRNRKLSSSTWLQWLKSTKLVLAASDLIVQKDVQAPLKHPTKITPHPQLYSIKKVEEEAVKRNQTPQVRKILKKGLLRMQNFYSLSDRNWTL